MSELDLDLAWQRHVSTDRRLLDRLLARHRERHRHYHTADHVARVLRHVEELAAAEPVEHLDEVVAAAFYHDAIHEPASPANERASARLARRDLAELGWSEAAVDRVAAMIAATAHLTDDGELDGRAGGDASDTAVLLDADLAVLGTDPAAYDAYVTGVRQEYEHLDDDAWTAGRASVLRTFLDRPAIYHTATGRARWEERARANLAAELASLAR